MPASPKHDLAHAGRQHQAYVSADRAGMGNTPARFVRSA